MASLIMKRGFENKYYRPTGQQLPSPLPQTQPRTDIELHQDVPSQGAEGAEGAEGARTATDYEKSGENTEVRCKLCGDKYPYNHMESHVVGVHGLDGPREIYMLR